MGGRTGGSCTQFVEQKVRGCMFCVLGLVVLSFGFEDCPRAVLMW